MIPKRHGVQAAAFVVRELTGVMGFVPPWDVLATSLRPVHHEPEEFEPGSHRGWQHEVSSRVDRQFRDGDLFGRLDDTAKALTRSQGGSGASLALSTCPMYRVTRLEPHLFRVLLLLRFRLPLSLTLRNCRCGFPLHHRAVCARAGVLGRRGYALESVAARICREAGGQVTTNVMVRDLDLAVPHAADARRVGSCGRWFATVRWGSTGCGHYWCALSMRTGQPAEEPLTLTTRSWWGVEVERALWFSPWRWGQVA